MLTPFEVFVPAGIPTVTYVDREGQNLEENLRNALYTPGMIISLSGPSKSGKTTLVRRVIAEDLLISVSGGAILSADMLWDRILNWMNAPSESGSSKVRTFGGELSGSTSGKVGIPLAGVEAKAAGKMTAESGIASEQKFSRGGIDQVVKEIANSDYFVFVDDFHYIPPAVQAEVCKQIKEVAEKGVRIATASVPHRSDDVVRGNTELRGRLRSIDLEYWEPKEIKKIAERGFVALNVIVSENVISRMTAEAFGSPQLMQQICLQACFFLKVTQILPSATHVKVDENELKVIFEQASTTTDYSTLVDALHAGPKKRGQIRSDYELKDGSTGDVYRCALMSIAADPPQLSLNYTDLLERARSVCIDKSPVGSSLSQALAQFNAIAAEIQPTQPVLEWSGNTLDIADPYFLYYLRCSSRLSRIARPLASGPQ